jgi:5-enolpyruvylshikimate-3-phosphate synthase
MLVILSRSSLHGELRGPSSKSVAQRLVLSTIFCSPGTCTLRQVVYSDDVNASLNFVKNLGINVETDRNKLVLEVPDELTVRDREEGL